MEVDAERAARRARREERRERQRAGNLGRAGKMHEARVEWEEGIEKGTEARRHVGTKGRALRGGVLGGEQERGGGEVGVGLPGINVGCSGWFYWHWRGGFYPEEIPTKGWFEHYASKFRTVELNAPFYSWPTVAAVNGWVRQAGRRKFVYTVKACELITHVRRFVGTKTLVRDFGFIADLLGARMGCFLFQLPPSFHYSGARLARILSQLDPRVRNVVEFRHRSWWREEVYRAFRDVGAIFCSCSGPRLPDELVCTGEEVYLRFHGTTRWYRHDYSKEELAVWAGRVRESGAKRVWAYFNNDRDCHAIHNARELMRQLKAGFTAETQRTRRKMR